MFLAGWAVFNALYEKGNVLYVNHLLFNPKRDRVHKVKWIKTWKSKYNHSKTINSQLGIRNECYDIEELAQTFKSFRIPF